MAKFTVWYLILVSVFLFASCSIPNLESGECSDARTEVKQFYSFHFGNDMAPSPENLKLRERFLTPEFFASLSGAQNQPGYDVFTHSSEPPTTFKIGKCTAAGPGKVVFDASIYWRTDERTVQKELHVEAIASGGRWLVSNVSN